MGYLKKALIYILAFQLAAPASFANTTEELPANLTEKDVDKIAQAEKTYTADKGFTMKFSQVGPNRSIIVFDSKTNNPIMDIPLSTKEVLRENSPKKLTERLKNEVTRFKDANKAGLSHAFNRIVPESMVFFMAMGAVVAQELIFNYSANPVGMQQHIQHQLSPMGTFGFFTFMYSQGVASNVLSAYITNPAYGRHLIPYLGMSVGSFVQSNLTLILTDPNVKACAKTMLGYPVSAEDRKRGVEEDPCEISYERMVVDQVPTITSMLMSSMLSAGIEKAIQFSAKRLFTLAVARGAPSVVLSSLRVPLWIFPGGFAVEGVRMYLTHGLKIAMFVKLDHLINNKVTYAWKNLTKGDDFIDYDRSIVNQVFQQKRSKWKADPAYLMEDLDKLSKASAQWRMINLGTVYQAHQNWSEMLQQLLSMYNGSKNFYSAFIEELIASKDNPNSLLNRRGPLVGIKAQNLNEGNDHLYLTRPAFLEHLQVKTAHLVSRYIYDNIKSGAYEKMGLNRLTIRALSETQNLLASEDITKIGQGIYRFLTVLSTDSTYKAAKNTTTLIAHKPIYLEYLKITAMLGEPHPIWEHGRQFGYLYEKYSLHANELKGLEYPKSQDGSYDSGVTHTRVTDYFVYQMMYGPDAQQGEDVIKSSAGFPATFIPPKIAVSDENPSFVTNHGHVTNTIYGGDVQVFDSFFGKNFGIGTPKAQYSNVIEYLKAKTSPYVIDPKGRNRFDIWWNAYTQSRMIEAFNVFEQKYQEVVVDLMKNIFSTSQSGWNSGPMANGPIQSIFQEARVYQMILGELLKDSYRAQHKAELPNEYFYTAQKEPVGAYITKGLAHSEGELPPDISILSSTRDAGTMEFDRLVEKFVNNPNMAAPMRVTQTPRGYSLTLQARVESEMYQMAELLKSIKVIQVNDESGSREVVSSDLENFQLEEQNKKLNEAIGLYAVAFGLMKGVDIQALVKLDEKQQKLAQSAIHKLMSLASELTMYGIMANSVTWEKLNNLKKLELDQKQFQQNASQTALSAARRSILSQPSSMKKNGVEIQTIISP